MNPRIERLREALEEPLLVTNLTNILYLFGFKSSNAALLVEPDRARLFTDFRYSEAARAVEGVEFEETKRALLADLADRLSGRIGFEADFVSYAGYETLRGGSIEPVPRRGLVERLRGSRTRTSSPRSSAHVRSPTVSSSGWSRSASWAAPSVTLRGRSSSSFTTKVPMPSRSRRSSRRARTRLVHTAVPPIARSAAAIP
jgi:hypothetical protein